jgi:hypothetical protein
VQAYPALRIGHRKNGAVACPQWREVVQGKAAVMGSADDGSAAAAVGVPAGPDREAAGETVPAGDKPRAVVPFPAREGEWAICCSGGGIRSASFCLGALQRLEFSGLLARARLIMSVSGGSYIAAARALVAGALPPSAEPAAYEPGTPEEQHLRDNTHYLVPDATTLLLGVFSLLVGVVVTFALVLAPVFAAAHAWGWLLRGQAVLCPGSAAGCSAPGPWTASVTAWTWWLAPAILGGLTFIAFWWWWLTLASRRTGRRDRSQPLASLVGWAALVTAAAAVAMLLVPLLLAWLTRLSPGPFRSLVDDLGFGIGRRWTPAALAGVFAAVLAISQSVRGKLQQWHLLATQGQVTTGQGSSVTQVTTTRTATTARTTSTTTTQTQAAGGPASGLLGRLGGWVRTYLLPWLGSAAIVLAVVVVGLRWTRDGVASGYSPSVSWLVSGALALMLILRVLVDVNRISLHDFYRWRLATAYAVIRSPERGTGRARRGAAATGVVAAPGVCLSSLAGQRPLPVFCTTANINAEREVPIGRGGLSLTFDPEHVILRGEDPEHCVTASTPDYETLVGPQRLTLFDVSAISGAAVSPLMGAATKQAYRILLTATNVRLGVWLPHPALVVAARRELDRQLSGERRRDRWPTGLRLLLWYVLPHPLWHRLPERSGQSEARLWAYLLRLRGSRSRLGQFLGAHFYHLLQPTLGLLWAEAVGHTSYRSTWICVTDGGHYDNLGLVEALRRGASDILVLDASGDKVDTWFTLGAAVAQARADAGVDITLDPTVMCWPDGGGRPCAAPPGPVPAGAGGPAGGGGRPSAGGPPEGGLCAGEVLQPWAKGTFTRLPGWPRPAGGQDLPASGNIWVCKLGWWLGAPWDVRAYAAGHPSFPTEPTSDQLFDDAEFDAYRELGTSAVVAAETAGLGRQGA